MQLTPPFSSIYFAFIQESFLSESSIYGGLTALKSAHAGDKGHYYCAFFNLAIGIERLLKIILALDHAATSALPLTAELPLPDEVQFRRWGHDLSQTYSLVCTAAVSREPNFEDYLSTQPIAKKTLSFLSEFSKTARYFNLNALGGNQHGLDPLTQWGSLLDEISAEVLSIRQRAKIRLKAELSARAYEPHIIISHDLSRQNVSLCETFATRDVHAIATNHIAWHLCKLIYGLRGVLEMAALQALKRNQEICPDRTHIPLMDDYCRYLLFDNKSWVFRKRRWP